MSVTPENVTDAVLVATQIGRVPREPWRVAVRCRFGRPQVIASPPMLADGTPFPTLFWLTCPYLLRHVASEESAGRTSSTAERIAAEDDLAAALLEADAEYRARRRAEGGGDDPCADVGIAGQRDPLATKCLHAHVAARLAGIRDPIGEQILRSAGTACTDDECVGLAGAGESRPR